MHGMPDVQCTVRHALGTDGEQGSVCRSGGGLAGAVMAVAPKTASTCSGVKVTVVAACRKPATSNQGY